jgi:hypothetical protein
MNRLYLLGGLVIVSKAVIVNLDCMDESTLNITSADETPSDYDPGALIIVQDTARCYHYFDTNFEVFCKLK